MGIIEGPCGTRLVGTGKTRFLGRPWAKVAGWPRIGVFGHPAALRCQRQGPSDGARPHGCCRGTMWVPCRVGGYAGKTRFCMSMGDCGYKCWGGGVVGVFGHPAALPLPETGVSGRTPWVCRGTMWVPCMGMTPV